jgi:hypothetical protein
MNSPSDMWHVFSVWHAPCNNRGVVFLCAVRAERIWENTGMGTAFYTRVEAGLNTSTVTLRVVGCDKKESIKSETVKYGREYQGTKTRERLRWQGPTAYKKDRPSSGQRGCPTKKKRPQLSNNKYLVMSPRWGSTPRLTEWLSVAMWLWLWKWLHLSSEVPREQRCGQKTN